MSDPRPDAWLPTWVMLFVMMWVMALLLGSIKRIERHVGLEPAGCSVPWCEAYTATEDTVP